MHKQKNVRLDVSEMKQPAHIIICLRIFKIAVFMRLSCVDVKKYSDIQERTPDTINQFLNLAV